MRSCPLVAFGLLVLVTACFSQQRQKGATSDVADKKPPKVLLLEVLETYSGVGGTNQFVYLRVFSDRSVEFHPSRNQKLKRDRVSRAQITELGINAIVQTIAREDVAQLPHNFSSTFTPVDFNSILEFTIPRGTERQKIRVVNFYPSMAKQKKKDYPEALVRLVCTSWAIRQGFSTETPDLNEECQNFARK
jgi:hypothetical protein